MKSEERIFKFLPNNLDISNIIRNFAAKWTKIYHNMK